MTTSMDPPSSFLDEESEHGTKRRLSDDSATSSSGNSSKSSRIPSSDRTQKKLKASTSMNSAAASIPPLPLPSTASLATSSKRQSPSSSPSGSASSSQNVRVVARVRPLSAKEKSENSIEVIRCLPSTNTLAIDGAVNKTFEYDAVFPPSTSQSQVYEHTVGAMIRDNVVKGFNTTILAYGQTGSGKTFTMGTAGDGPNEKVRGQECDALSDPNEQDGIVPRAVYDLFRTKQEMKALEFKVELAYLEIYNEEIRDLLKNGKVSAMPCRKCLISPSFPEFVCYDIQAFLNQEYDFCLQRSRIM